MNNLTADGSNLTKKYAQINRRFSELYSAYIDASDKYRINFIKPGAHGPTELTLTAVDKAELDLLTKESSPVNEEELLPYSRQFSNDYAVLKIKSFAFYDWSDESSNGSAFAEFIDGFFQTLAESKTTDLILDLRDNWGGDPYCTSYLYRYLIKEPHPYFATDSPYYEDLKEPLEPASNRFQGNLYILIDGACFSSTGHLCSLIKYHKIGTFIGEETSGSYVCTSSCKEIILKNTKLIFYYSTAAYKTAISGLTPGRGIMPDYPVNPTLEDYLADKDVVKEFAVDLIHNSQPVK